jgi:hypothetical protein
VSKHYGPVGRYMMFVRSASQVPVRARSDAVPLGAPVLRVPAIDGAEAWFRPAEGDMVAVFIPPGATPFPMMFLDALDTATPTGLMCPAWIDPSVLDQRVSLAENLALPTETDSNSIERAVMSFEPQAGAPLAPGWLNRPPAELPQSLPDWVVCAVKVVAARERGQASIALRASLLAVLPETWGAACRQILGHGVVFVLHANPALIGRFGERAALIGHHDGLLCWAPIEKDRLGDIKALCRHVAQPKSKPLPAAGEQEFIEE